MSDSVADKSGFLCTYMSNHPDTLAAYVSYFGKVNSPIGSVKMASINSKAMTLVYNLKASEKKEQVQIKFDPPLVGYDEVKPRLLSMKLDAEESLGMVKRPVIKKFVFPLRAFITLIPLGLLTATTFSQPNTAFWQLGQILGGDFTNKLSWGLVVVLHSLEAIWVGTLCKKHSTGFVVGAAWTLSTLALGFPMWFELRKMIQMARIDSIAKIH